MSVPLINYANLEPSERGTLERTLAELTTLERVLGWAKGLRPAVGVEEILTQDEYTHDVLIPGPSGRYLNFDTT